MAGAFLAVSGFLASLAQDFPVQPITIIVGYGPRDNPAQVSYTTTGAGSTMHVGFQYMKTKSQIHGPTCRIPPRSRA